LLNGSSDALGNEKDALLAVKASRRATLPAPPPSSDAPKLSSVFARTDLVEQPVPPKVGFGAAHRAVSASPPRAAQNSLLNAADPEVAEQPKDTPDKLPAGKSADPKQRTIEERKIRERKAREDAARKAKEELAKKEKNDALRRQKLEALAKEEAAIKASLAEAAEAAEQERQNKQGQRPTLTWRWTHMRSLHAKPKTSRPSIVSALRKRM